MFIGIIKLIGAILFLYLTWRNLKDNYNDDLLISYSWLSILMFVLLGRIVFGLINWGVWNEEWVDWLLFWQKPGFNYWGGVAGILLATYWFCRQYGWKLWSFLEDMTGTIYLFMAFILADELWSANFNIRILIYVLVALSGYILSNQIASKYRSFVWYKSGKKGFVFFFTNTVVAILSLLMAISYKDRPTVWILYLIFSLISVTGLFILGEVFDNLVVFNKRKLNGKDK